MPLALESVERRVQRALLDAELTAGDLLHAQEHAIPVQLSQRDGFQDQQVESPWKQAVRVAQYLLLS
jgi:hypothetical protein